MNVDMAGPVLPSCFCVAHSKGHAADSQEPPVGVGSPQFDHTIISVYVERVSLSVTQVFLELAMQPRQAWS